MYMKNYSGMIKLMGLLFLAPIVIWQLGIGKTYTLFRDKKELEMVNRQTHPVNRAMTSTGILTNSEPLLSNGKFLQLFTDSLSSASPVEIVGYTPEMIDSEGDYKLYCGKLTLSGGYIELVRMVHAIEKASLPLKIASMSFETDAKKRNEARSIFLHLYMEQIEH